MVTGGKVTQQFKDILVFNGDRHLLDRTPLSDYWNQDNAPARPAFNLKCTACWRGYTATWTVNDGRLCLLSVRSGMREEAGINGRKVLTMFSDEWINEVFPQQTPPIPATWFTGELICSWGQVIDRPMRYSVVHEGYKILNIKAGRVESIEDHPPAWYYQRYDLPTPEQRQRGEQR